MISECQLTSTNSLSRDSRYGNVVVFRAELMGPRGAWTAGLTFPCWVWTLEVGRLKARLALMYHSAVWYPRHVTEYDISTHRDPV